MCVCTLTHTLDHAAHGLAAQLKRDVNTVNMLRFATVECLFATESSKRRI
jgi:hypothetical protein